MKPNLSDLESLISAAKELKKAQQSFEKKSTLAMEVDLSMSQRAIGKATADMHWDAMHVDRCWDTLHAKCVDLGLCDPHEPDFYRPKEMKWSGFHGHVHQPEIPRTIKQSLIVGSTS